MQSHKSAFSKSAAQSMSASLRSESDDLLRCREVSLGANRNIWRRPHSVTLTQHLQREVSLHRTSCQFEGERPGQRGWPLTFLHAKRRFGPWFLGLFLVAQIVGIVPV